jgi:hypothetical protein
MPSLLAFPGSASDALDPIVDFLPRLAGAIVVLVIGLLLARYLSKALTRLLLRAKIDQMGDRVGLGDSLARVGLGRSVSHIIAGITRFFLWLFVIVTAVGFLGVETLEEPINEFILFLPQLLVAIAIVFLGVIIAGYVSDWVNRVTGQMGIEGPLGAAAGALVIGVFMVVVEGTIARFESSHVVLAGADGETIRVPNRTVLESVVVVTGPAGSHPSPY